MKIFLHNTLASNILKQSITVNIILPLFSRYDFDPEQFAGSDSIPMLVIGSKQDLAEAVRERTSMTRKRSSIADECGADEINLVSRVSKIGKCVSRGV